MTITLGITLEYAQTLYGDPEAISRGYITEQTIADALDLANEVILMPTFGRLGYLAEIGNPHQWWLENCSVYRKLEGDPTYRNSKRFSALLKISEYLTLAKKIDAVSDRVDSLRLLNLTKTNEYTLLKEWISQQGKL